MNTIAPFYRGFRVNRPVIHRIMTDCRAVAASSRVSKSRPKGLNHDSVTAFGSRLRTEYCLDNNEGDGNKPFLKFSWDAFVSTSASASCASGNYRSLRGKFDIPREIYSKLHLRILSLMHVAMAKSVMGKSVMGTVISSAICHQYVMSQHCTILRGLLDCGMLLSGFPLLINAQCNVAPVECCPCRVIFFPYGHTALCIISSCLGTSQVCVWSWHLAKEWPFACIE